MDLLPAILIGYAVGSLPIGYLVTQGTRGVDLRRVGSGNVGAANVYRTSGLPHGDCGDARRRRQGRRRGVVVGGAGAAGVVAGVAAVVGHVYPVWLGFRGGKGVATASGVFGVLSPVPTVIAAAAFTVTVAQTRFVSLGSIVATILLPVIEWLTPGLRAVDVGATIVAALILFRHRGNMVRLWSRTERALGDMSHTIGVLGSGSWGTALAVHLARTGHEVRLVGARSRAGGDDVGDAGEPDLPAGHCAAASARADHQHPGRRERRGLRGDGGAVAWPA